MKDMQIRLRRKKVFSFPLKLNEEASIRASLFYPWNLGDAGIRVWFTSKRSKTERLAGLTCGSWAEQRQQWEQLAALWELDRTWYMSMCISYEVGEVHVSESQTWGILKGVMVKGPQLGWGSSDCLRWDIPSDRSRNNPCSVPQEQKATIWPSASPNNTNKT